MIASFLYFLLAILHGSFLFVFAIVQMVVMCLYVPSAVLHAVRRSKRTWDRAGSEIAYLGMECAVWFSECFRSMSPTLSRSFLRSALASHVSKSLIPGISVLGLYWRGPSYCAEWSFNLGQQQSQQQKNPKAEDGPNFNTNTQVIHSCDVDTVLNAIACTQFVILLIWLLWIIYLVRHLPFERKIALKCGVARLVRGEYTTELGLGTGTGVGRTRTISRQGTMKRSVGEMEMGTIESNWSTSGGGTNVSSDATTLPTIASQGISGDVSTTSPEACSPVDGANNAQDAQAPPLPPRPDPLANNTELSPSTQYYGPPLGPRLPPSMVAPTPGQDGAGPLHVEVADIPPPAYETHTTPGASGSTSQLRSPTQLGSSSSATGTMDFDSFMRAQQHKMEYKLMLERTGQLPPSESPGEMGPGEFGSGPGLMWGAGTEHRQEQRQADRQGTWAASGASGAWGLGSRGSISGEGGGSQRRRRGSM